MDDAFDEGTGQHRNTPTSFASTQPIALTTANSCLNRPDSEK